MNEKQAQVLALREQGTSNTEVARRLNISSSWASQLYTIALTVRDHERETAKTRNEDGYRAFLRDPRALATVQDVAGALKEAVIIKKAVPYLQQRGYTVAKGGANASDDKAMKLKTVRDLLFRHMQNRIQAFEQRPYGAMSPECALFAERLEQAEEDVELLKKDLSAAQFRCRKQAELLLENTESIHLLTLDRNEAREGMRHANEQFRVRRADYNESVRKRLNSR